MNTHVSAASMPRTTATDGQLDWLLDHLVTRAAHIEKAAILSRDGFVLASSAGLTREDAEHLSALAAGIQSLAKGGALHFGGGHVHQSVIEMDCGFLFVTAAGQSTCLAVLAAADADVGLVAYEMALLVKQVGGHLAVERRSVPEPSQAI